MKRFHKFFFAVKVILFAMSILSLYFLTSSSPNKGDAFGREVFVCINPLALLALPLYFATQNTGGEGEMYIPFSLPVSRSLTGCFVMQNIGEVARSDGGVNKKQQPERFVLLAAEKNEPRIKLHHRYRT